MTTTAFGPSFALLPGALHITTYVHGKALDGSYFPFLAASSPTAETAVVQWILLLCGTSATSIIYL